MEWIVSHCSIRILAVGGGVSTLGVGGPTSAGGVCLLSGVYLLRVSAFWGGGRGDLMLELWGRGLYGDSGYIRMLERI